MAARGLNQEMSLLRVPHPARIYPNRAGRSFVKESLYLSSPKNLFGFTPGGFYVASPPHRSEESKKKWRSEIGKRISSEDAFAWKFVAVVDEMQKRAEEYPKRVWGS